jgi:hypothetical protein
MQMLEGKKHGLTDKKSERKEGMTGGKQEEATKGGKWKEGRRRRKDVGKEEGCREGGRGDEQGGNKKEGGRVRGSKEQRWM